MRGELWRINEAGNVAGDAVVVMAEEAAAEDDGWQTMMTPTTLAHGDWSRNQRHSKETPWS